MSKQFVVYKVFFRDRALILVCPKCEKETLPDAWFAAHVGTAQMSGKCKHCGVSLMIPRGLVVR